MWLKNKDKEQEHEMCKTNVKMNFIMLTYAHMNMKR
jgi:hypothetical protein